MRIGQVIRSWNDKNFSETPISNDMKFFEKHVFVYVFYGLIYSLGQMVIKAKLSS